MNEKKILELATGIRRYKSGRPKPRNIDELKKANVIEDPDIAHKKHEIARLMLTGMYNKKEIGEKVNMSPSHVSLLTRHDPELKAIVSRLQGKANLDVTDVRHRIKDELAPMAADVVEEMLSGTFDPENYPGTPVGMLIGVAKDTLSRAGYSPITRIHSKSEDKRTLSFEEIRELRLRSIRESIESNSNKDDFNKDNRVISNV